MLAGGALSVTGCAALGQTTSPPGADRALAPPRLDLSIERLMRITVCLRPFRAIGPRIEAESVGDKKVIHNYGHGGAGWTLSWGSAQRAAALALADGARDIAVIGAGAIGLTSALTLAQAGARVTIYADKLPSETRSARATGTWSPDSRIALASAAPPDFAAAWETMTRASFDAHQAYVGLAGAPVEWTERYVLSDLDAITARALGGSFAVQGFSALNALVRDLTPPFRTLDRSENPFPVLRARHGVTMTFNVAEYAHRLLSDFLLLGGRIERRVFHAPAELSQLPQPVILNCTGYGARTLWRDDSITPVRGQIAWLAPHQTARYGFYYRDVAVLARSDGIVVQETGEKDSWGFGEAAETPDRAEFEAALAKVAPLFARA
jgi:glycine/D-amino acid oxidase-like deaminating enzyme